MFEDNALWEEVKESLGNVPSLEERTHAELQAILYANYHSGRIKQVIEKEKLSVNCYVRRVVRIFQAQHSYVVQVRVQRDDDAWETLYTRLFLAVYGRLGSAPLHTSERKEFAREYTQEATFGIMRGHYPYDIDFMQWAYKIVFNAYGKGARHSQTQMRQAERYAAPIEDWQESLYSPQNVEQRVAGQRDLVEMLATLSDTELTVLKQLVEGYSQNEIAAENQCSPSTISRIKKRIGVQLMQIIECGRYIGLHGVNRTMANDIR